MSHDFHLYIDREYFILPESNLWEELKVMFVALNFAFQKSWFIFVLETYQHNIRHVLYLCFYRLLFLDNSLKNVGVWFLVQIDTELLKTLILVGFGKGIKILFLFLSKYFAFFKLFFIYWQCTTLKQID